MRARSLLSALLLLTLGSGIAQPGYAQTNVAQTNVPVCRASDVSIKDTNISDAGMSKSLKVYLIENKGSSGCSLSGYPTISVYDASGRRLPRFATYSPSSYFISLSSGPARIRLAAKQTAWFAIQAAYACDDRVGRHLTVRVALPGSRAWLRTLTFPNANCPMIVTPIRAMSTLKLG